MPIWLTESHLESYAFVFFFSVETQLESLAFFLESLAFFLESQQIGIPRESHTLFLESFQQGLESHTSPSLFSKILCLFRVVLEGIR